MLKHRIKNFISYEQLGLFFIIVFVFINWLLLINIEKLATPDYYEYYIASEKLFSGNFKIGFIPPLFPFLIGLAGRFLNFIGYSGDCFIMGGRIISLFSGIGVTFFSYKLLKKWVNRHAVIGVVFLVISPFFLKLLTVPQTDMFYLFFVSMAFYFFLNPKLSYILIWPLLGGFLTRFEGVLLIGSAYINYFSRKTRYALYIAFSVIPVTVFLYFFFQKFAPRLIKKIDFIISNEHYLYFFKNPTELANLFFGNILYFISPKFPPFLKWIFFYLLLISFFCGIYYVFKYSWKFGVSITFYFFTFVIFKGYTRNITPEIEFRRMLSPIWIFFIVSFVGFFFLLKRLSEFKKSFIIFRIIFYLFLVVTSLFLSNIKGDSLFIILILVPVLLYGIILIKQRFHRFELIVIFLIFLLFTCQLFFVSVKKTYRYVSSVPNKAGFLMAKWLNKGYVKSNVVVYSNHYMIKYYLKSSAKIRRIIFKDKDIYGDRKKLLAAFLEKLKKHNIKYIAFDMYLNVEDQPGEAALKKMLFEERDKGVYFIVVKHLFYKGLYVATVLKPIFPNL